MINQPKKKCTLHYLLTQPGSASRLPVRLLSPLPFKLSFILKVKNKIIEETNKATIELQNQVSHQTLKSVLLQAFTKTTQNMCVFLQEKVSKGNDSSAIKLYLHVYSLYEKKDYRGRTKNNKV